MTYNSKQNTVNEVVLNGILQILDRNSGSWNGTMTQLSSSLVKYLGKSSANVLPGSPSALRVTVNRVVNRLRHRGVSVKFTRTPGYMRTRLVTFSR